MSWIEPVKKRIVVDATQERAFRVFTARWGEIIEQSARARKRDSGSISAG